MVEVENLGDARRHEFLIFRVDFSRRKMSFTMAQDLIKMKREAWSLFAH